MEEPLVIFLDSVRESSLNRLRGGLVLYDSISKLFLLQRSFFFCMTLDWQMRPPWAVERVAARKTSWLAALSFLSGCCYFTAWVFRSRVSGIQSDPKHANRATLPSHPYPSPFHPVCRAFLVCSSLACYPHRGMSLSWSLLHPLTRRTRIYT